MNERYERGLEIRRAVLGAEYVDAAVASADELSRPLQELDPRILLRGRVFVDDIRQCREDGEINVALREGLIGEADVAGEIGKVIVGELEGRQSDDQVTVFDSTGIALQDSATVPLEVERAYAAGVGIEKKMIST